MHRRMPLSIVAVLLFAGIISAEDTRSGVLARLRHDLSFLASAECEGRGPGTEGIDRAADFIADAFRQAGLKGAMPDGSFFQPFSIRGTSSLGKDVGLTLTGADFGTMTLKLNASFAPLGVSGSGSADAPIVFVGYGVTCEKPEYDDYAGVDVAGKIVLMIRKSPRYGDEKKPFADDQVVQQISALATKVENAKKHKAAAVLMVNDASEKDDALLDFRIATGPSDGIPAIHIRRSVGDLMLRYGLGKSLQEIEKAIDADLKPMSAPLNGWSGKAVVTVERKMIPAKNVVGVLEGAGPLANQTLVIGAHYDHLGYGGRGSLASGSKAIHFGADDNASGTTSIIELARRLAANPPANRRRLVFIAFSGEEMGLLGSAHYANNPIFPLADTVAMINLDMVGRLQPDPETQKGKLEIGGTGTAKSFDALIDKLNAKYDFKLKKSATGVGPSDHTSFYLKGVPVFFFFTGLHKEYHKPTDVPDLINFEGMSRIVDMVEELARTLWTDEARPEYVKGMGSTTMGSVRGNVPRLGFMPGNYDEDTEGVAIGAVTKDGPADKGGIKEGDVLVEVAGRPVKNMTAYMTEMGKQKKGEPVELTIVRKGERIKVTVTPQ